ncbi:MAG: hypothetical protein IKE65_01745 [Clostridia bacterium]|nr:hypothetical protein [Clostridia bacterium]
MPYIKTTTNVKIDTAKADIIKAKFGRAIEAFPGKSEGWLMLSFADESAMYFKGSSEPCAIAEVSLYGSVNPAAANNMTAQITDILSSELSIAPARIYVKYDGIENWGWNGANF